MHPRLERDIARCKSAAVRFLRDFAFKSHNALRLADRVYRGGIPAARSLFTPQAAVDTAVPDWIEAVGNQGVLNR
jgi:hypothetical protein